MNKKSDNFVDHAVVANPLGATHVRITMGDGEVVEERFEGAAIIGGLPDAGKLRLALHMIGGAAGMSLLMAQMAMVIEDHHGISMSEQIAQMVMNMHCMRTQGEAVDKEVIEIRADGARVPSAYGAARNPLRAPGNDGNAVDA